MDDVIEEKSFLVAKNFASLMDNPQQWSSHVLSEDAIMDWFGRSVYSRHCIINFIRLQIPKMHHTIEKVTRIPRINHRSLKYFSVSDFQNKYLSQERGQGDCRGLSTPENVVQPNMEELVKAPCKKRYRRIGNNTNDTTITDLWQFVEIKGKLELHYDGISQVCEKKLHKIILGYTDQIHLVIYEGKNLCRKKLSPLFNIADE